MLYTEPNSLVTRRQAIIGGGSVLALGGLIRPADAFGAWWIAFTAAVAAGWLVEALKNWGLVPHATAPTPVHDAHEQEALPLQEQGYSVKPLYRGAYSGGDFELSEATRGDDFLALSTTSHWNNTCTHRFDTADAINLGLVAKALNAKGFDPVDIQASAMPIHPPGQNQFSGSRRQSATYMTPSHGTIAWSTEVSSSRGNFVTSIRSDIVAADLRFAQREDGRWVFDMTTA
jgi:hypothetical protein